MTTTKTKTTAAKTKKTGQLVTCQSCGRDTIGGPYCGRCTLPGGVSQRGEGFHGRQGWRDVRVIAGSPIDDVDEDLEFGSDLQWHGSRWSDD